MTAEAKFTGTLERGNVVEVVHRNHTGRVIRISKYLFRRGTQRPISEMIFDPEGNATLYVYNETGEDVKQVIRVDKGDPPG